MIPDISVLWVILFVLLLSVLLDRLLFRPVTRVMQQRDGAIRSARDLAETSAAQAQHVAAEFEARTQAARTEVYREMDEKRRAALERRAAILAGARREADVMIGEATGRVRTQAAEARRRLERDADSLAAAIVARVLDRQVS